MKGWHLELSERTIKVVHIVHVIIHDAGMWALMEAWATPPKIEVFTL